MLNMIIPSTVNTFNDFLYVIPVCLPMKEKQWIITCFVTRSNFTRYLVKNKVYFLFSFSGKIHNYSYFMYECFKINFLSTKLLCISPALTHQSYPIRDWRSELLFFQMFMANIMNEKITFKHWYRPLCRWILLNNDTFKRTMFFNINCIS